MITRSPFDYRVSAQLPPLAWSARIRGSGRVEVRCGTSVRVEDDGFFEGSWVGPPRIAAVADSTCVFGSGMIAAGDELIAVPPSHPLERLYFVDQGDVRIVSNSLVAVLVAGRLELDPDGDYPSIFVPAADGLSSWLIEVPTRVGPPVGAAIFYNLHITPGKPVKRGSRPAERPFSSFADYRQRLTDALASALANAPSYEMVVSLSSGYDSTAVAAVAASLGCRRAVTFAQGKPVHGSSTLDDSGTAAARRLGMSAESFDRLAYLRRTDLPEAEFLASGMSGEDVVMSTMERHLSKSMFMTGSESFRLKGNPYRPGLYRGDLSGCSLTEFRLRVDFVHLPLLFFGASEHGSVIDIIESDEMTAYTVAGRYDKPIQRRLAEEAGIPRGTFATLKRRSSATIHRDGLAALAPASAAAVRRIAATEGIDPWTWRRPGIGRRHRLLLRIARGRRAKRLVSALAHRRRSMIHAEPRLGSLLFRWAVSVTRSRYADLAPTEANREDARSI